MKLQQIVWKIPQIADSRLYYTNESNTELYLGEQGTLRMKSGQRVRFDTYFNSFGMCKWVRYTRYTQYSIQIEGEGDILFQLWNADLDGAMLNQHCMEEKKVRLEKGKPFVYDICMEKYDVCYPVIQCVSERCELISIGYYGELAQKQQDVHMAIDICTFKREPYLERNLKIIKERILDNPCSVLYGNLEIFVSDNAQTLGNRFDSFDHVHVNPNANVGGVGGFTRGIIEALEYKKEVPFTHILIMDDDAVIEPSAIERTYALLCGVKSEYRNATVGGGLLRENTPHIQYESGAVWDRGNIVALHHHYDLSQMENVLRNELEEKVEYTGWWYTVIPVQRIKEEGLPLPLFIHRDDIEYGIRAGTETFILMNGIAVWHEAFENKMPGATEYYDLRNMAIINSIHYGDYSKKELKHFVKRWVISNIVRYRYEYVDMNILGIEDFCKGIDWLLQQDGEVLHRQILAMNYKAKPAKEYIGYNNITADDIEWSRIEQVQERRVTIWERLFKMMTFNGAIFPAKGLKVVRPHGNLYDMFRAKEVLYVDSVGNGLLLRRDNKKAIACFKKLRKVLKLIDTHFDQIRDGYAVRYKEMTTIEFWKQYLKMNG